MVYCVKCGAKNDENAEKCVGCGAPLETRKHATAHKNDDCFGSNNENCFGKECFGLPYGGAIFGIIFGIIILVLGIVWAVSAVLPIDIDVWGFLGPLVVIVIGILIIAGVGYRLAGRF